MNWPAARGGGSTAAGDPFGRHRDGVGLAVRQHDDGQLRFGIPPCLGGEAEAAAAVAKVSEAVTVLGDGDSHAVPEGCTVVELRRRDQLGIRCGESTLPPCNACTR